MLFRALHARQPPPAAASPLWHEQGLDLPVRGFHQSAGRRTARERDAGKIRCREDFCNKARRSRPSSAARSFTEHLATHTWCSRAAGLAYPGVRVRFVACGLHESARPLQGTWVPPGARHDSLPWPPGHLVLGGWLQVLDAGDTSARPVLPQGGDEGSSVIL